LAAEWNRRLGAPIGQLLEAASSSAGQDQRQRVLGGRRATAGFLERRRLRVENYALDDGVHGGMLFKRPPSVNCRLASAQVPRERLQLRRDVAADLQPVGHREA